ncbi:hypothetical protein F1880_007900 [Penicillium rolfsii]|nr:hypothetical protein F1880_007900 [Penicillium rolfsii]
MNAEGAVDRWGRHEPQQASSRAAKIHEKRRRAQEIRPSAAEDALVEAYQETSQTGPFVDPH